MRETTLTAALDLVRAVCTPGWVSAFQRAMSLIQTDPAEAREELDALFDDAWRNFRIAGQANCGFGWPEDASHYMDIEWPAIVIAIAAAMTAAGGTPRPMMGVGLPMREVLRRIALWRRYRRLCADGLIHRMSWNAEESAEELEARARRTT